MPGTKYKKYKTKNRKWAGVSILEILIALVLLAITSMFVYSLFSTQIGLFLRQTLRIDVSSENKIALSDITNQTRQAESIATNCPPTPCSGETATTGPTSVVYRLSGLDSSGNPTASYYDYLVYKQVGTNLKRIIYKDASSTRAASDDIIASNLAPVGGMSFEYDNTQDYTKNNNLRVTVTTTKTADGKTQSISQSARAKIRNQGPDKIPLVLGSQSGCPTFANSGQTATVPHTTAGNNRLLIVTIQYFFTTFQLSDWKYDNVAMTKLDEISITSNPYYKTEVWYLINPNPGTHNISATNNNAFPTEAKIGCNATSWTGVSQTTPFGTIAKLQQSSSIPSTINVASNTNEIVYSSAVASGGFVGTPTPGSSQTVLSVSTPPICCTVPGYKMVSYKPGATGTTSMSWTDSGGHAQSWGHIGVAIKPGS